MQIGESRECYLVILDMLLGNDALRPPVHQAGSHRERIPIGHRGIILRRVTAT